MKKLKVAILEDNSELLKDLRRILEETKKVDVITWASNSTDFLEKVRGSDVEALILDIELIGDSMNGIDVANKLKLPTLFVSGKTRDFITDIESLNFDSALPIEHITKPINSEKLDKVLSKFIAQISAQIKSNFVFLNFKESRNNKIDIRSIVFLETEEGNGGKSNNKRIYFTDRKPEILIDFSFTKMNEKNFDMNLFATPHQSYRINKDLVIAYNKGNTLSVKAINASGDLEEHKIPVSENYRSEMKKSFR